MPVRARYNVNLQPLVGSPMPTTHTASLPTPQSVTLVLELSAVDRLSCALTELRLDAPYLSAAGFAALEAWGKDVCTRITYLLEQIGPLEVDPAAGTVLIRSDRPDQHAGTLQYYEILLQQLGNGQFTLRRYRFDKASNGRVPVDLYLTHETLDKLVNDLIASLP